LKIHPVGLSKDNFAGKKTPGLVGAQFVNDVVRLKEAKLYIDAGHTWCPRIKRRSTGLTYF